MIIKPVYSNEIGHYLDFEATNNQDKKSLRFLANELTSAGIEFGSVSVNNKMCSLTLNVTGFKKRKFS